jgi:hypothetical protein
MSSSFDSSSIWRKLRDLLGFDDTPSSTSLRRTSRRERDEQNTRMLVSGLAIVAVITVITILGGVLYENVIKPNTVLATVGGEDIDRRDYWKYHSVELYQQANEYEQFAAQVEGQQRTQFLTFASSFRAQADDVWGTTDVSDITLSRMVQDQLFLISADNRGLDISDDAIEGFVLQQFSPEGAQLVTPYPQPTLIPTRAAWATETAEAQATINAEALGTPAAATPISATPVSGTPISATPVADATPDPEAAAEAQNNYAEFQDVVFDSANISEDDYYRLVARPQLARDLVASEIGSNVPQSNAQVHAFHILVSTEDLARELYERATGGANFQELARANSTDQLTSTTGGDLGWFTPDAMVEPVTETAFSMEPGSISEPVESQFGWHIIMVEETDDDRPLTALQYNQAQQRAIEAEIESIRADTDIDADVTVSPTPSPTPTQFNPPADAPTPEPATPVPAAATPVAQDTPAATPIVEGPVLSTPEPES